MKNVAFIPARGGSKSIPHKNIKLLCGKPLIQWSIEAALACNFIDIVYVATDSLEIAAVVNALNNKRIKVIERSAASATDEASSEIVLLEFARQYDFDTIFFIQATSPLLSSIDLNNALTLFETKKFNSLLSVVKQKRFIWKMVGDNEGMAVNYAPALRPRRQDWNGYFVENGAFYVSSRESLLQSGCRISGKIGLVEMCEESFIEIDEPTDWQILECVMQKKLRFNEVVYSQDF